MIYEQIFSLKFCRNEGGKLAEPKSDTETSEIDYLIKQTNGFSFWIGTKSSFEKISISYIDFKYRGN